MDVTIAKLTQNNFANVIALELEEAQKTYIEPNVYTIAESTVSPSFHLTHHRAIYLADKVVGFAQYQYGAIGEEDENECTIWRFMIDRRHQNAGIGKMALILLLNEIKQLQRCQLVDIYYDPENIAAKKLYASQGFKDTGHRRDGDIVVEKIL